MEIRLKTDWKCSYFRYNVKGGGYINLSSDIPTLGDISLDCINRGNEYE